MGNYETIKAVMRDEFERTKVVAAAIIYPTVGIVLVTFALYYWENLPKGSEWVALFPLCVGMISFFYGVYQLFKLAHEESH